MFSQKHFIAVGLLGGVSYFVASTLRPDLRPILQAATFVSFVPLPYTHVVCECRWIPLHHITPGS